jgi:hypothetical protein
MAQPNTAAWYARRNQELGLPAGTRWSSDQYQAERQRQVEAQRQAAAQAEAQRQHQARLDQLYKEQQNQIYHPSGSWGQNQPPPPPPAPPPPPPPPPPPAPTGPTPEEIARRRDEWDRLNKQGKYDPDGWQSIGHQPMPKPIPDWWLTGPTAPPTTPPAPPAAASASWQAATDGPLAPAPDPNWRPWHDNPMLRTARQGPNALVNSGGPQSWGQKPAWKPRPDMPWMHGPTSLDSAGPQSWAQNPAGSWGRRSRGSWGQNQDQVPASAGMSWGTRSL